MVELMGSGDIILFISFATALDNVNEQTPF